MDVQTEYSFEFKGMKDVSLGHRKIRWPTMQDKLFECDRDWWPNANLDLGGKGWLAYLTGYKRAADALAKQFLRNWQGNDNLIYPKVFLYRQSLEPQLKLTIIIAYRLLDEQTPSKDEMFQDHSLQKLWARCRPAFERIAEKGFWPRHRKGAFEAVEKLILEFHNIDPSAEYFRYPFQKPKRGGKPTLPKLSPVGIENLRKGMRHLHSFFNAHIDGIDVYVGAGKDY